MKSFIFWEKVSEEQLKSIIDLIGGITNVVNNEYLICCNDIQAIEISNMLSTELMHTRNSYLFLPINYNDGAKIDMNTIDSELRTIGSVNSVKTCIGYWKTDSGILVKEPVSMLEYSRITAEFNKDILEAIRFKTKQDALLYVNAGVGYFI